LQRIAPDRPLGILVNPDAISAAVEIEDAQNAAKSLKVELITLKARTDEEINRAFAAAVGGRAGGLLIAADSFFTSRRVEIVLLAARHAIAVCYPWAQYVQAGGLFSYGPSIVWAYDQLGVYAAKILKGEMPNNLPVQFPTKFEMTVNLRAAKILGISLPPNLLAGADEIID